jgi:starch synthase (maltosyl-transferring)
MRPGVDPQTRIQIQEVTPAVDCGRYAAKRTTGEIVDVRAIVFKDGHDALGAAIRVRGPGDGAWHEVPFLPLGSDRFAGSFTVDRPGIWTFRIAAWTDRIATWQEEVRRKVQGGQEDLTAELAEGAQLLGTPSLTLAEGQAAETGDRHDEVTSDALEIDVDRPLARFGSWYELFPRLPSTASTSSTCRRSIRSG